jgi:Domain of unknown function (DUF4331)
MKTTRSIAKIAKTSFLGAICGASLMLAPLSANASSHREAPLITTMPKVDGTDFYMFRSYEPGRGDFVTIVADYEPLQDPFGGPNYFELDPAAVYDINIDNVGDAKPHLTFRFNFTNTLQNLTVPVGGKNIAVPLVNIGQITAGSTNPGLNVIQTYSATLIKSGRFSAPITDSSSGSTTFTKPLDNVGMKSLPDYVAYANQYLYQIDIPGCGTAGRMFVGQRKDPFVVNLGDTFDLINYNNPVGPPDGDVDSLFDKNVTSIILEAPIACLVSSPTQPIIGGWTTASLPQNRVLAGTNAGFGTSAGGEKNLGPLVQVSRLANPLFNELIIGLKDKDRWNASQPQNDPFDAQFTSYVTNPTLPALIHALFPSLTAPTLIPRSDLVATFLTGVKGLNQPPNVTPAEEMRLNTSIAPTPFASQNRLGVIAGDDAGYPNGRRPGDDVVDISLQVAIGKLIAIGLFGSPSQAPSGNAPLTDQAIVDATHFDTVFPYIKAPLPGSPNGPTASGLNGRVAN